VNDHGTEETDKKNGKVVSTSTISSDGNAMMFAFSDTATRTAVLQSLAKGEATRVAKAWVQKWLIERRQPASGQTESAPEFEFPTMTIPDTASEQPPSLPLTQAPIDYASDYASKARDLLGAGKSPTSGLWNLAHDPSVNWPTTHRTGRKPTCSRVSASLFICG
jgi:hypothetical protein